MITLAISLANADDRRRELAARLDAAGLDYQFIDAIFGKALPASEVRRVAPNLYMPRYNRDLTPGEIGCSLSHKLALETFLRSGAETALILEDDAAVPANIGAALAEITPALPPDWGMLKLGGEGLVRGRFYCKSSSGSIIDAATPTLVSHAYLVSRVGAECLLRRLLPIAAPFDVYLRDLHTHRTKVFEVVPNFMTTVDRKGSQIAGERISAQQRFWLINRPLLAFWRLRHELGRRAYVLRRFGMKAAISPSKMQRFG